MTDNANETQQSVVYSVPNCPNVGPEMQETLNGIVQFLNQAVCSESAALSAWANAQFAQINATLSTLSNVDDLNEAVQLLTSLKEIVDANGDGILDALGPLQAQIATAIAKADSAIAKADSAITKANSATTTAENAQQLAQIADEAAKNAANQATAAQRSVTDLTGQIQDVHSSVEEKICSNNRAIVNSLTAFRDSLAEHWSGCSLPEPAITNSANANPAEGAGESNSSNDPEFL